MKTFNVKGGNWSMLIDIDETVYEKFKIRAIYIWKKRNSLC